MCRTIKILMTMLKMWLNSSYRIQYYKYYKRERGHFSTNTSNVKLDLVPHIQYMHKEVTSLPTLVM